MNRKELTKTFIMISKSLVSMVNTKIIQLLRVKGLENECYVNQRIPSPCQRRSDSLIALMYVPPPCLNTDGSSIKGTASLHNQSVFYDLERSINVLSTWSRI